MAHSGKKGVRIEKKMHRPESLFFLIAKLFDNPTCLFALDSGGACRKTFFSQAAFFWKFKKYLGGYPGPGTVMQKQVRNSAASHVVTHPPTKPVYPGLLVFPRLPLSLPFLSFPFLSFPFLRQPFLHALLLWLPVLRVPLSSRSWVRCSCGCQGKNFQRLHCRAFLGDVAWRFVALHPLSESWERKALYGLSETGQKQPTISSSIPSFFPFLLLLPFLVCKSTLLSSLPFFFLPGLHFSLPFLRASLFLFCFMEFNFQTSHGSDVVAAWQFGLATSFWKVKKKSRSFHIKPRNCRKHFTNRSETA